MNLTIEGKFIDLICLLTVIILESNITSLKDVQQSCNVLLDSISAK